MVSDHKPAGTEQCSCSVWTAYWRQLSPYTFADVDVQPPLPSPLELQQKTKGATVLKALPPPANHHRVQPPGQNLRSQQLRQAPHTNVEKNLRSDGAIRLKDSQIWCEPSRRFSDGVNVCRTNTKVACPHGRLLLRFQSWPQGSKSRTAENVSRGFAYKTMQITPSRPSGAEMLLFCLAPARAPYVNKAGDTSHPRETCRKTEVHFPHGAGRKVLPTVT